MDMDIPVFDWFEEPIKESIHSVFSGINTKVEALDLFKQYRASHIQHVVQHVSGVKILGMQQPIDIADLYYPAKVSTDIRRRLYTPEWKNVNATNAKSDEPSINALTRGDTFVELKQRVVVLGGPGAGKTTFLKYLALAYADKSVFERTKLDRQLLPTYIHLPALARDDLGVTQTAALPLLAKKLEYAVPFLERVFEQGLGVVFFDSLDEVPLDQKAQTINRIKEFAKQYPKTKIVVSCRTADYTNVFEDFADVELSRLSKEAVEAIVKAWFGKDTERRDKLLAMLETDDSVAALTQTPLLLSLLCIQFRNDLALPKRRTELYRRCVDALIRDWDTTRGFRRDSAYSQLSDDRKEKIFEAIAGNLCTTSSIEYVIEEDRLIRVIAEEIERFGLPSFEAKGILTEIESHHGIVEKCSASTYEFSHGTMQEYFAARFFCAKRRELEVFRKQYENAAWHSILVFACSILDDPAPVLNWLVERSATDEFKNYPAFGRRIEHLLLLYRCMAIGVLITQDLRARICDHLVQSQVAMIRQINSDGVFPYAARRPHGVRQALFFYNKPRTSIAKVLQPYRRLMNEIFLSPIETYASRVVDSVDKMYESTPINIFAEIGLHTCLLVPLSEAEPKTFMWRMFAYSQKLLPLKVESVRSVVVESFTIQKQRHPRFFALLETTPPNDPWVKP